MITRLLGDVEERVRLVIAEHGDKAVEVLRAALERASEIDKIPGTRRLGDFDYRGVKAILENRGINYNPSILLRKMEREYEIIETTYRSSSKHWWRFKDKKAVTAVIAPEKLPKDPESTLIKAQYIALEPERILEELEELKNKEKLNRRDVVGFRRIVFGEAERVVELLRKMEEAENLYEEELSVLRKIIEDIEIVAARIEKRYP